jgi:hypothetical protein
MSRKLLAVVMAAALAAQSVGPAPQAAAQVFSPSAAGRPGVPPAGYNPPLLKGMTIRADNPFQFDFIIDTGDESLEGEALEKESLRLVKYFLASLTTPESEMWVNLNPAQPDRIVPEAFGATAMGRDLLEQDYLLKQLTAEMLSPESETGARFWENIRRAAGFEVDVNLAHKIWIVPERAGVFVNGNSVFLTESRLKVMLEDEYFELNSPGGISGGREGARYAAAVYQPAPEDRRAVYEVIIPAIEQEINHGRTFSKLRQIFHSLSLAVWYKRQIRAAARNTTQPLLAYVDRHKTGGLTAVPGGVEDIYQRYLRVFRDGAREIIKEDYDPVSRQVFIRKYITGGVDAAMTGETLDLTENHRDFRTAGKVYTAGVSFGPDPDAARTTDKFKNSEQAALYLLRNPDAMGKKTFMERMKELAGRGRLTTPDGKPLNWKEAIEYQITAKILDRMISRKNKMPVSDEAYLKTIVPEISPAFYRNVTDDKDIADKDIVLFRKFLADFRKPEYLSFNQAFKLYSVLYDMPPEVNLVKFLYTASALDKIFGSEKWGERAKNSDGLKDFFKTVKITGDKTVLWNRVLTGIEKPEDVSWVAMAGVYEIVYDLPEGVNSRSFHHTASALDKIFGSKKWGARPETFDGIRDFFRKEWEAVDLVSAWNGLLTGFNKPDDVTWDSVAQVYHIVYGLPRGVDSHLFVRVGYLLDRIFNFLDNDNDNGSRGDLDGLRGLIGEVRDFRDSGELWLGILKGSKKPDSFTWVDMAYVYAVAHGVPQDLLREFLHAGSSLDNFEKERPKKFKAQAEKYVERWKVKLTSLLEEHYFDRLRARGGAADTLEGIKVLLELAVEDLMPKAPVNWLYDSQGRRYQGLSPRSFLMYMPAVAHILVRPLVEKYNSGVNADKSEAKSPDAGGPRKEKTAAPGGIDLNPRHWELNERGDDFGGVVLPVLRDGPSAVSPDLESVDGLYPVILHITPVNSLPLLLGGGNEPGPPPRPLAKIN